jgi:hypothetical protein
MNNTTMVSTVTLVDVRAAIVPGSAGDERDIETLAIDLGIPKITGNFLYNHGVVKLVSPNGETYIIANPIRVDNEVLVHFSFGTEGRRIGHTLTVDGLKTIVNNLTTILALAKLEQENP